jgi:hypothetical protein
MIAALSDTMMAALPPLMIVALGAIFGFVLGYGARSFVSLRRRQHHRERLNGGWTEW